MITQMNGFSESAVPQSRKEKITIPKDECHTARQNTHTHTHTESRNGHARSSLALHMWSRTLPQLS